MKTFVKEVLYDAYVRPMEFVAFVLILFLLALSKFFAWAGEHGLCAKSVAYGYSHLMFLGIIALGVLLALEIAARIFVEEHFREKQKSEE